MFIKHMKSVSMVPFYPHDFPATWAFHCVHLGHCHLFQVFNLRSHGGKIFKDVFVQCLMLLNVGKCRKTPCRSDSDLRFLVFSEVIVPQINPVMDHDLVAMVTGGCLPGSDTDPMDFAYVIRKTSWIFFDEWCFLWTWWIIFMIINDNFHDNFHDNYIKWRYW